MVDLPTISFLVIFLLFSDKKFRKNLNEKVLRNKMKNLKSKKAGVKFFLITKIEKRKKKIYRGARHRITPPRRRPRRSPAHRAA